MPDKDAIQNFIIDAVASGLGEGAKIGPETALLGKGAVLSSLRLVELLLQVEDYCLENDIPFVWTTDAALSEKRSHYRTVESLSGYVYGFLSDGRKDAP
ncbi:MAG: hypothetical protein LBN33_03310 [Desulfovibrio sp.]|jgi:hypothetical protein|nr:hypothetical protein [Desulfovibrio sp.]